MAHPHCIEGHLNDSPFSERLLFNHLKTSLNAEWSVFHGLQYQKSKRKGGNVPGDLDLLLIHPLLGLFGLEVKGGDEIEAEGGIWKYRNSKTKEWHTMARPPGDQALDGIYTWLEYFKKRSQSPRIHQLPKVWGVAFTGVSTNPQTQLSIDLPRNLILDEKDITRPLSSLKRVFRHWTGQNQLDTKLLETDVEELTELVYSKLHWVSDPTFSKPVTETISQQIEQGQKNILALTDDQIHIVESSSEQNKVNVRGPAGTGKTIVAIEIAKLFNSEGKKVLLLFPTDTLAAKYRDRISGVRIESFKQFCLQELDESGMQVTSKRNRLAWRNELPNNLRELLKADPTKRWDAIVIDEGQNFEEAWVYVIDEMLSDDNSKLWVFSDPNQDVTFASKGFDILDLNPINLTYNVRNSESIATKAYGFINEKPRFKKKTPIKSPVEPKWIELSGEPKDQERKMAKEVRRQLDYVVNKIKVPHDQVVVLSWDGKTGAVWKSRGLMGNFKLTDFLENADHTPNQNSIDFCSIEEFQGLDAEAIILCDVPSTHILSRKDRKALYVGASRAKQVQIAICYTS